MKEPDHSQTGADLAARLTHDERQRRTRELMAVCASAETEAERRAAQEEVVVLNMRVAVAIAHRYAGRGISVEDLEQVACEGLTKAVYRFDPGRDRDLLSYAVPTIRGEVQRHFRDLGWSVRPPRRVQELQWRVSREAERLCAELGREPTAHEVSVALDIEDADYDEAMSAAGCFHPTSLDQSVDESGDGFEIGDTIATTEPDYSRVEARVALAPLVRRLSERERRILYLRFYEEQSQREIGEELGVTQTQVSRWLSGIYERMHEELAGSTVAS